MYQEAAMTPRLETLKDNFLKAVPSITINRAVAFTEVTGENPDLPRNLRRAKCFRRACETAPLLIQEGELIVGHPCGAPRAGAFSPDTAWEWVRDECGKMGEPGGCSRAFESQPGYCQNLDKRGQAAILQSWEEI